MFGVWGISYEGTNYEFGTGDFPVELVEWEQSTDIYEVDDSEAVRADGLWMGEDFIVPGVITINVKIDFTRAPYPTEVCVQKALQARAELEKVWRADKLRATKGGYASLNMGGSVVVEGRPRRIRFDDSYQSSGLIYAELPFVPSHPGSFIISSDGSIVHSSRVDIVPPSPSTGWVFPLVFPVKNLNPAGKSVWFEVGGDMDAACKVEVHGPIQAGAVVEVPGHWSVQVSRGLAYDEVAVFDAWPGSRVVTVNGYPENVLTPSSTKMSGMVLPPGVHQLSFRGISPQGTAYAVVYWRNTKAGK